MNSSREDVYATLLLNDLYLPGALVLAHSLRDGGTKKKLAVLYTPKSVSSYALNELREHFDYVIPVERIENEFPDNLQLMNRPDLHSTFTKILLWKQSQFQKIVYLDSDMLALRAPDELFDLPYSFSAAPDIGWPDIFNSGLMVLSPNENDYNALVSMAQKGTSFDGADQGLLNIYFTNNFHRLSFTYNVSPSAHYQYAPAYQYFRSKIVMLHFIGQNKPWLQGRCRSSGSVPVDEMSNLWWSVYDRHQKMIPEQTESSNIEIDKTLRVQIKNDSKIEDLGTVAIIAPLHQTNMNVQSETRSIEKKSARIEEQAAEQASEQAAEQSAEQSVEQSVRGSAEELADESVKELAEKSTEQLAEQLAEQLDERPAKQSVNQLTKSPNETFGEIINLNTDEIPWQQDRFFAWDASKEPPPADSKPEALNLPKTQYIMSSDPNLFEAPDRYPDPPNDMWFEVPKAPTYQKLSPIFPWEINAQKPSRVFARDNEDHFHFEVRSEENPSSREESTKDESITATTTMVSSKSLRGDNWKSFTLANAWDDVPEIKQYVGELQSQSQRQNFGHQKETDVSLRARTTNLFNFNTNSERQILPVTPAPLRRLHFWGNDEYTSQPCDSEGVPSQEEWDPRAALEHLAYHQLKVMTWNLEKDSDSAPKIL